MKPRIALLFAGGTIGMVPDKKTGSLRPAQDASAILELIPKLRTKITLNFFPIINIDSSNMTPEHWTKIARKIKDLYDEYDGFIVAQGTDTMAYTASALAFALQNLSKPVVFTGSLIPLSELGADGRNNLIYACLVAAMDIAEVCIVFGHKIIRGCRAKKNHESFVDVFHSPNFPMLGEISRPIKLNEWRKKRRKRILKFQPEFESDIRLIKLFPGFQAQTIEYMIDNKTKGIVIEGYGPGNIPFLDETLMKNIKRAHKEKIPVIITSQMERSVTNLHAYEAGHKALEAGAISAHDMTSEATITKLMWSLAQTSNIGEIKEYMERDMAGEITAEVE